MAEAEVATSAPSRPDLLAAGRGRLGLTERLIVGLVRRTFEPGRLDRLIRFLQRWVGSTWIHYFTKNLRFVFGLERLPRLEREQSYLLVSNHRSFFDLYVVIGHLVRRRLRHRIVFPVRAEFFYTGPLGLFVNGVMSFFAMYPPIFRTRKQLALNPVSLDELAWLLRRGGYFCGVHPEGTRKKDDDPYTFLPAQRGVGRVIHEARVPVIPVFINGLLPKDLGRQVASNFDGTGRKIVVVFGEPIDFTDLYAEPGSPKVHQAIADRTLEVIGRLGEEERVRRAELEN
jgi:1-acyl-sn-glycerol-3-phosphate acyltransferase